ncbi:uncharacterized protein [Ptychodera flava]|uniref:uncharacterized protein n=1 Tax=Ptychodera flava TaxID=63121 RepID=UPI003969C7C2
MPALIGVTGDGDLVGRDEQDGTWSEPVPNSCCVTKVAVMTDGSLIGIGKDKKLYTKESYGNGRWEGPVDKSCCVTDVAVMPDGTIVGISHPRTRLVSKADLDESWVEAPNGMGAVGVDVFPDGRILGVAPVGATKLRDGLNGKWSLVKALDVQVDDIAVQPNGKVIGIKTGTCTLHLRDMNGTPGSWTPPFPNSGCVSSIVATGNIVESGDILILTTTPIPVVKTDAAVVTTEALVEATEASVVTTETLPEEKNPPVDVITSRRQGSGHTDCKGLGAGFYPFASDCRKFLECNGRDVLGQVYSCPTPLLFSRTVRLCSPPDAVPDCQ